MDGDPGPNRTIGRMAARSIGSVTLIIGLVAIPLKLFTATSAKEVKFNRLDRASGARVKQKLVSEADGRELAYADLISGYEYTPDQFVTFDVEELTALDAEADPDHVRITEVVPAVTFEATNVAKTIFLGPDKGANRAYHLVASLLANRGLVAVGQRGSGKRDDLIVIAPHGSGEGLVMHECFYADEVRLETLREVPDGVALAPIELELAGRLFDSLMQQRFAPERFVDGGAARVQASVEKKIAGHRIVLPPPRKNGDPIDLLAQLRASVPELAAARGPKKTAPKAVAHRAS